MMHTVEDTLEVLSGDRVREVHIRLDQSDRNLLTSLSRQVRIGMALTDRQLDLALTKISKYKDGLLKNNVDVDLVLATTPLRMPLRVIDRTQSISFGQDGTTKDQKIHVKFTFSKKIGQVWDSVKLSLEGHILEEKNVKSVAATELNLYKVVEAFKPLGFIIDDEVEKVYEKIDEILKNSEKYATVIDFENGKCVVNTSNKFLQSALDQEKEITNDDALFVFLNKLKNYGIFEKTPKIIEKIESSNLQTLTKNALLSNSTRLRVNPEKYSINDVVKTISDLNQWPVLVFLDETNKIYDNCVSICNTLKEYISNEEITVFFRLDNGQPDHEKFNQYVKENQLNNYIDRKTKVVFITKNRIPKPLMKADWQPQTAIVVTNYDFGKTAAYLNDFHSVYYYNSSITVRHDKIKGSRPIAEL